MVRNEVCSVTAGPESLNFRLNAAKLMQRVVLQQAEKSLGSNPNDDPFVFRCCSPVLGEASAWFVTGVFFGAMLWWTLLSTAAGWLRTLTNIRPVPQPLFVVDSGLLRDAERSCLRV
jgi:hypothetical protein